MAKITSLNLTDELVDAFKHTKNRSEVICWILTENIDKVGMHTVEDRNDAMKKRFEELLMKDMDRAVKRCMKKVLEEMMEDV